MSCISSTSGAQDIPFKRMFLLTFARSDPDQYLKPEQTTEVPTRRHAIIGSLQAE